ncbi:MAG: extracellular solute-binding protein [Chloroflexota bacterium]
MKPTSQKKARIDTIIYRACSLLIALSLLLSACQSGQQRTTPASGEPGDVSQTSGQTDNALADADEHPVITFAISEWERSRYEPLVERFNAEHPEITVQLSILPQYSGEEGQSAEDYYHAQASSGDTFIVSGVDYIPAGYLRDVQPMIDTDATFEADDFWHGALQACQDSEGRQLGVPTSISLNGIFYDREAFDAAGLPYPKPGWTLDDFQKTITALAKQNGDEIRYGFALQYGTGLEPYIETVLDAHNGEIDVKAIEALFQWYIDLIEAKAIYSPPYVELKEQESYDWNKQWQDWQNLFKDENRPAMWAGSITEVMPGAVYIAGEGEDALAGLALKEDGVAPLPVMSDGSNDNTNLAWAQCLAISAGSQNPRAAWTWLNFLSHQSLTQDDSYTWERLQIPMRMSIADSSGYWDILPEGTEETLRYMLAHAWYNGTYRETTSAVSEAIRKAAVGKVALATALEEARNQAMTARPSATPNTTPIVVATPKPTLSADTTVVEYFTQVWGPERDALQALVDEYNQDHPETTITLRNDFNYSGEDYISDMVKKFDCFTWYPSFYIGGENKPDFLPLDALVQAEGPAFLQDFDANLLENFRQDGALIGLPAFSQPQVMGYNADLLAKRGLEPPKSDWTFDDFVALATQATSQDEADQSYGLTFSEWDSILLDGRGIQGFDPRSDPPLAAFDSPDFASGLAWLNELLKAGTLLVQTNDNYMEIQEAISQGKVAFWTTQAGQPAGWYSSGEEPSYQIGIAPMPAIDNPASSYLYWSNDQAHYISAQTENQQACWNWIKYLSEQPGAFSGIPARKSVVNSPEWEAKVSKEYAEVYRLALSQVKHFDEEDLSTLYNPASGPFGTWQREIVSALLKGEDYAKIIPQAQQKAEDYLACMASVDQENLEDNKFQEEIARCARQADPNGEWGSGGGGGGG